MRSDQATWVRWSVSACSLAPRNSALESCPERDGRSRCGRGQRLSREGEVRRDSKRGRLLPFALLDDLSSVVDFVIAPPDAVEGDVVDDLAALQAVGPDVPSYVVDPDDAGLSCRFSCAVGAEFRPFPLPFGVGIAAPLPMNDAVIGHVPRAAKVWLKNHVRHHRSPRPGELDQVESRGASSTRMGDVRKSGWPMISTTSGGKSREEGGPGKQGSWPPTRGLFSENHSTGPPRPKAASSAAKESGQGSLGVVVFSGWTKKCAKATAEGGTPRSSRRCGP